jgi:hypothetical protein
LEEAIEGGACIVCPAVLEGGEVVFEGVEGGSIRREEQERGPGLGEERVGRRAVVEGRVIQAHDVGRRPERAALLGQPGLEPGGSARPGQEPRREEGRPEARRQPGGARAARARPQAGHPVPCGRRGGAAGNRRRAATRLAIAQDFAAPDRPLTQPQRRRAFAGLPFPRAERVFAERGPGAPTQAHPSGAVVQWDTLLRLP